MRGKPYIGRLLFGLLKPKDTRLGRDVAGQVEAVGRNVIQFKPGDEVFGACHGAFAEYACAIEDRLAQIRSLITLKKISPRMGSVMT